MVVVVTLGILKWNEARMGGKNVGSEKHIQEKQANLHVEGTMERVFELPLPG